MTSADRSGRGRLPQGVYHRVGRTGMVSYRARWRDVGGTMHSATFDTAKEAAAYREERLREVRVGTPGAEVDMLNWDVRGGAGAGAAVAGGLGGVRPAGRSARSRAGLPAWGTVRLPAAGLSRGGCPGLERYAAAAPKDFGVYRTSCGT